MKRYMLLSILVLGVNLYAESEEHEVADTVSVVDQVELAVELATVTTENTEKTDVEKCPCSQPSSQPRPNRPNNGPRRRTRVKEQTAQETQKAEQSQQA